MIYVLRVSYYESSFTLYVEITIIRMISIYN